MAIDPHDWLEAGAIGAFGLNDRSMNAGASRLQMNNRGKNKVHIEWAGEEGVQLCGKAATYWWYKDVSLMASELDQLCPKCLAELARRDRGGA